MPRMPGSSVALLLLLACRSPVGGELRPELIPGKESIAAGETARVVLRNRSEEKVRYGACDLRLERETPARWELIGPARWGSVGSERYACIGIAYVLLAGAKFEWETSGLVPGAYRFCMEISPKTIYSPPSRIVPEEIILKRSLTTFHSAPVLCSVNSIAADGVGSLRPGSFHQNFRRMRAVSPSTTASPARKTMSAVRRHIAWISFVQLRYWRRVPTRAPVRAAIRFARSGKSTSPFASGPAITAGSITTEAPRGSMPV
jgi:hypothetical protein